MSTSFTFSFSLFLFIIAIILITNHPSYADHDFDQTENTAQLIDQVCKKTKIYNFCVNVLNGDPRTPGADRFTLVDISFRMAYNTATETRDRIIELLNDASNNRRGLERCGKDYDKAIEALGSALNDLNSESFSSLPDYAKNTSRSAEDCEAHYKPLDSGYIKSLCEVCVAVASLYGGDSS